MTVLPPLAVTGSTGAVGGLVARLLADQGVPQRLLVRDAARAPELDGAEVVTFAGYADRPSAQAALDGVTLLLMVSGSEAPDRLDQHRTFVDAAAAAGVRHLVYTSFLGAAPDCTFTLGRDHFATEQHIQAAGAEHGMTSTFLRDSFYLDFLPEIVDEQGVIRGPAGDGRVSAVARADVARSAAAVLLAAAVGDDAHHGATYDLTGPEALTLAEAATVISEAQGREVRFHDETLEEAYESRRAYGAPDWQVDAWVSTYTAIARGEVSAVSDDVERLTGRRPTSLAELLRPDADRRP